MRIKYLQLSFLFFLITSNVLAQLGNTHFVPPFHTRVIFNSTVVYLSTPNGDASHPVTVTIRSGDGTILGTREIFNGQENTFVVTPGPASFLEVSNTELSLPLVGKGLILEGTDSFYTTVKFDAPAQGEYLTAKGEEALGTSFRLGSAPNPLSPIGPQERNFYAGVMATEDNTTLNFSDIDPGVTFENGPPGSPVLMAGETFVVSGYAGTAPNFEGFIGALLTSDKPIVVNAGNLVGTPHPTDRGQDLLIDQIVDESKTGFEYLLVRGKGAASIERPLIIANQADTEIFINGTLVTTLANTGDHILLEGDNLYQPVTTAEHRNMFITTNDPTKTIYVYQFIGGNTRLNTPGMNFIPPLNCNFQQEVDLIPRLEEFIPNDQAVYEVNTFISAFAGTTVAVNGLTLPAGDALANPGTADWVSYLVSDISGNVVVTADGPIAVGIIGGDIQPNGLLGAAGFAGYFSGFSTFPEDVMVQLCRGVGTINLFDQIDGDVTPGGTWVPALASGGDLFDPMVDPDLNPSLVYEYQITSLCAVVSIEVVIDLVENPIFDPIDVMGCDTFMLPDPATLTGSFLNNPQYFTTTQTDPNVTLIDWTTEVFTTDTSVFLFDQNGVDALGCSTEIQLDIIITATPTANQAPDLEVCNGSLDNDLISIFDLTLQDAIILNNQSQVVLSYHTALEDAELGANAIATPSNYTNTQSPQVIYARAESELNAACFDITSFNLIVIPIADVIQFEPLLVCNEGDETGTFDLTTSNELSAIPSERITGFYTSLVDAEAQVNEISDPFAYQNTSNPQTIFIRIEGEAILDCFEIAQLNLEIENCDPFVPEGFSPNGDGVNDVFEISGLQNVFVNYELNIYSRLGNLIYTGNNNTDFWDGMPNKGIGGDDNLVATGVYYWVLTLNDPTIDNREGWVYLNR